MLEYQTYSIAAIWILTKQLTKPHISHIYTEVAQKQGNNQIAVKQRKNGNSPYTNFNEFSYRCQDLITFQDNKQLGTTS